MKRKRWLLGLCVLACGCLGEARHRGEDERARRAQRATRVDEGDAAVPAVVVADDDRYIDCLGIKAGRFPKGVTRLESFEGTSRLAASEHVLFGTRSGATLQEIWARTTPLGTAHVVAYQDGEPQVIVPDGDQLFFDSPGAGVSVSRAPIAGGTPLTLARAAITPLALLVDGDRVFWLGNTPNGGSGLASLFSTDREPGNTRTLATLTGPALAGALVHIGDFLYFAIYTTAEQVAAQLQRFDLQSEQISPLGQPDAIAALATDGESLFAGLIGMPDALGNPTGGLGLARVALADGSLEPLFPQRSAPVRMLAVDATTLYWSSDAAGPNGQLWRGDKTGAGDATLVAAGWQGSSGLVQNADGIFWTVPCGTTQHVLRARK